MIVVEGSHTADIERFIRVMGAVVDEDLGGVTGHKGGGDRSGKRCFKDSYGRQGKGGAKDIGAENSLREHIGPQGKRYSVKSFQGVHMGRETNLMYEISTGKGASTIIIRKPSRGIKLLPIQKVKAEAAFKESLLRHGGLADRGGEGKRSMSEKINHEGA